MAKGMQRRRLETDPRELVDDEEVGRDGGRSSGSHSPLRRYSGMATICPLVCRVPTIAATTDGAANWADMIVTVLSRDSYGPRICGRKLNVWGWGMISS